MGAGQGTAEETDRVISGPHGAQQRLHAAGGRAAGAEGDRRRTRDLVEARRARRGSNGRVPSPHGTGSDRKGLARRRAKRRTFSGRQPAVAAAVSLPGARQRGTGQNRFHHSVVSKPAFPRSAGPGRSSLPFGATVAPTRRPGGQTPCVAGAGRSPSLP